MDRKDAIARLTELARAAEGARDRSEATASADQVVDVDPDPYRKACADRASEYDQLLQACLDQGVLRESDLERAGLPRRLRC